MKRLKVKEKLKAITHKTIATVLLTSMVFPSGLLFAVDGSGYVIVPTGCQFVVGKEAVTRSGSFSYVNVRAKSVFPTGFYEEDTFTRCKVVLRNPQTLEDISNVVTLVEGAATESIKIFEGKQDILQVGIYFAGNDPEYAAEIAYAYNGK